MSTQQTWNGPDPADITAWTIVQAGHFVGQKFYRGLATVGLSPTQFGTLLQLDRQPELSNNEIARLVHVSPQSMSELLGSLVGLGLIARDAQAQRGRRVAIRLTPSGRQALQACQDVIYQIEQSLGLTITQANRLNQLLQAVITAETNSPPASTQ